MRLSLIGVSAGAALEQALSQQGFKLSQHQDIPAECGEAVVFAPQSADCARQLAEIRQRAPESWLGLVLEPGWLKGPFLELASRAKPDELWLNGLWEIQFSLTLPRIAEQLRLKGQLDRFEKECEKLREEHDEISARAAQLITQFEKDVALASNIQRSLLPKKTPVIPDVRLAAKYRPAMGFGGDYYDIFEFGDKKRYGFLVADSKTHGMAAALLTVLIKIRLEEMKDRFPDSKSFVEHLNREIQNVHRKEMNSLSLFYGILDRSSLTLQYTTAGSIQPLLWRLGEATPLPTAHNPALGEANDFAFKESFISLKPADLLLLHTDGLEGPLRGQAPSAREALATLLQKYEGPPNPQELQNDVMGEIDRYTEAQALPDDVTLIQILVEEKALYVASESK